MIPLILLLPAVPKRDQVQTKFN